jgi:hypothetical protein
MARRTGVFCTIYHSISLQSRMAIPPRTTVHFCTRSWELARDRSVAHFIEPMECLPVEKIPEGDVWTYELKLDGYRLIAVKTGGKVTLYSRRGTDLSQRFKYVRSALASLPDETVVDGEIVALDEQGKPTSIFYRTSARLGSRAASRASVSSGPLHASPAHRKRRTLFAIPPGSHYLLDAVGDFRRSSRSFLKQTLQALRWSSASTRRPRLQS